MASLNTIAARGKPLPVRIIVCEKCGQPVGLRGFSPAIRVEQARRVVYYHSDCRRD